MKGNEISLKELRPDAVEWLTKLHQTLVIKEYGKGTVRKIGLAGYLHAKNKMERIAAVCKELKLPPPMQKVYTPVALRLLLQTDRDVLACPMCGKGRMKLVKTLINHHGVLMDIAQLRNRGSPKIKRTGCSK